MIETILLLIAVVAIALSLRLPAAWQLDMTWDEGLYAVAGMMAVRNILRRDFSERSWSFEFHPPFVMYLFGISYAIYVLIRMICRDGWRVSLQPEKMEEEGVRLFRGRSALLAIRLPAVLAGTLTCAVVFWICQEITGNVVLATIGSLLLAVMPSFVAWTSVAMLESGVTLFYASTVLFLLKATAAFSIEALIVSGICLGFLMCSKETGFGMVPTALVWFAFLIWGDLASGSGKVLDLVLYLIAWLLIGVSTFWVSWPVLHRRPLQQLMAAFRSTSSMSSRSSSGFSFYFLGLASTVPTPIFFLTFCGVALTITDPSPSMVFAVLWVLVPLLLMGFPFVPKRGGPYETNFVLPSIAILAVVPLAKLEATPFKFPLQNFGIGWETLAGVALVFFLLFEGAVLYPRYMDYHSLVGRKLFKEGELQVGWWGHGMASAMAFIDRHVPMGAVVWIYGPRISSFYHSTRVDLRKSLGGESLFFERARVGKTVPLDSMFLDWRQGDLTFKFPYYPSHTTRDKVQALKKVVSHIVVYRWALHNQRLTSLGNFDVQLLSHLSRHSVPVATIKTGQLEVCWIYDAVKLCTCCLKSSASNSSWSRQ